MNFRDTLNINKNGHLQIGGVDTVELAQKYGTPLYVMDEFYIRNVVRAFKNTIKMTYSDGNLAYASKAFCCKEIYRVMKDEGVFVDVMSAGEIFTAISAGFDLKNAVFHGNNKLEAELDLAISNSIGIIVVDNLYEVELIDKISAKYGRVQDVLIRINPGVEAHTHTFIQTSKVDSKFGFAIKNDEAIDVIKLISSKQNVRFKGLHCHIGSQIFDKQAFILALDVVTDYIVKLNKKYSVEVETLNMGGGFGIYYSGDDPKYNVEEYCNYVEQLTSKLNQIIVEKKIKKPFFMIEPGRSVVGEAGITLYRVGNIKEIKGIKKYISADGGMSDNIRPALYDAKYEAILANRANEIAEEVVTITGKCCESADMLVRDIMFPKVKRDDIIAVFSTGAYNHSMASNYNKNPVPPVVFVSGGQSRIVVKPQTLEDLTRNDL